MKSLLTTVCAALVLTAANASTSQTAASVSLDDFKLTADLTQDRATFTLSATARVEDSKGGSIEVLSGPVALTQATNHPQWRIRVDENRYVATFDHRGKFPLQLKFDAALRRSNDWSAVEFRVAPGAVQRIILHGLSTNTDFDFPGAARPERSGNDFISYLPADGSVKLAWKQAKPETEGKLFYSAEMLSQITVSPGLMRQVALVDLKIMQGELNRLVLELHGDGEVTRVQGEQVLAWSVETLGAPASPPASVPRSE